MEGVGDDAVNYAGKPIDSEARRWENRSHQPADGVISLAVR